MARSAAARKAATDLETFRTMLRERSGGPHSYVALLGLRTYETPALLEQLEAGFAYGAAERLRENVGITVDELAALVQIPRRTLARRRAEGRLGKDESDRLLRAARVFGKALALFEGDLDAAREWFASPAPALGDRAPREVASTEMGARAVEDLVGRLEHGVFS